MQIYCGKSAAVCNTEDVTQTLRRNKNWGESATVGSLACFLNDFIYTMHKKRSLERYTFRDSVLNLNIVNEYRRISFNFDYYTNFLFLCKGNCVNNLLNAQTLDKCEKVYHLALTPCRLDGGRTVRLLRQKGRKELKRVKNCLNGWKWAQELKRSVTHGLRKKRFSGADGTQETSRFILFINSEIILHPDSEAPHGRNAPSTPPLRRYALKYTYSTI